MKRPIIKGTPFHKAAKSIVTQTRTQADSSLVGAGQALGKSYIPAAIDFSNPNSLIDWDSEEESSDSKGGEGKKKFDSKKDANEPSNKKEIKEVREGKGFGDGPGTKGWGKNNKTKRLSLSDRWKAKRSKKRLAKAEKDGGVSTDTDYSQIDNEPKTKRIKAGGYKTPSASSAEAKEGKERMDKKQENSLNKAAKKYNVKPGDLEAKEINGKKEFFPKQSMVGGKQSTQWDDKLGRFRKAEASTLVTDAEKEKAIAELKPKYPKGMDPNLEKDGEIALNYETNSFEYTPQYSDRLAREKIKTIEAEKTKEVVAEKPASNQKTATTGRKPRPGDFEGTFREKQEQYKVANEKWYQARQAQKGKSPVETRDNRVYRNALKDGPVRRNMIKGGYTPE